MAFRFTEEDFNRYVKMDEHGGRHIWHDLQKQLEASFGVTFTPAPFQIHGDWLQTLWFFPKGTPRPSWKYQAMLRLARNIKQKQLAFGLAVECPPQSTVDPGSGFDPDRDGLRLLAKLEHDPDFAGRFDQLVSQPDWRIEVYDWSDKLLATLANSTDLLNVLKQMSNEEGWAVGLERVMSAQEAVAAGESIVPQIMDAYRAVSSLWEAIMPEADREFLKSAKLANAEESEETSIQGGPRRESETYARQVIEALLPEPEIRTACLNLLADYIIQAHQAGQATWGITLFHNRVRLNVGRMQTFVIYSNEVYLVTDAASLLEEDRVRLAQAGRVSLEVYANMPEAYDVQVLAQNLPAIRSIVQNSYMYLIQRAAGTAKRTPYYRSHSPGVPKYLRAELDREIPEPDYGSVSPPLPSPFDLRAMLSHFLSIHGLAFTPWQLATFYTALQTKGFVILSGISGTGKTKLAQAFAEVLPQPNPVALLGAADPCLDRQTYEGQKTFAYWWSYPIRGDVEAALQTPFRLYIYHKGQITHYYTVSEFITQSGDQGIKSPWSEITLPEEAHRTGPDDRPGWKFKTWCKATQFKELGSPIQLSAVRPLFGYTNDPSALRNALVPIEDPLQFNDNLLFVPVRPDWRDGKSLLGYYNPLDRRYVWTDFLRFLLRAVRSYQAGDGLAWFVILDEMNLARVEYYFADLLSVLESGRDDQGWTREPLRLGYPDEAEGELPPRTLRLPPNLYVIGTVNVDETTHAFSPKVLDRAFTLELTEADFSVYPPPLGLGQIGLDDSQRQTLLDDFTVGGQFARIDKEAIADYVKGHSQVRSRLQVLNNLLRSYDLHFGYRVFDEIVSFLVAAEGNGLYEGLGGAEAAFDAAVLMKVLPKFHGSRGKLEMPLLAVLAWCMNPNDPTEQPIIDALKEVDDGHCVAQVLAQLSYCYPKTAQRVRRMLGALYTTGFAAFC
jgi:5-methylcytosine-specific restriction protein B